MILFSEGNTEKNEKMVDPSIQLVYTTEQKVSVDGSLHLRQENKEN